MTLWFIHELAKACEDQIFTLVFLEEKLSDLIIPIADTTVEIYVLNNYYMIPLFQFPLDYVNGILDPKFEDVNNLPSSFAGPKGTHYLAEKTLELLQKFCIKKYSKPKAKQYICDERQ